MKAVLPVAGMGSRLRPLTLSMPKVLVPVAGRAMIDWIMDELVAAGLTHAVFIVGYRADLVEAHIRRTWPNIKLEFVAQEEMLGLGHAVSLGLSTEDQEVFIILGDTLFSADIRKIRELPENVLGVKTVDDPRRFGVAETRDGLITRLVEKPEHPQSNLALVGLYNIKNGALLKAELEKMISEGRKTRGEYQITDALQSLIDGGESFKAHEIGDWFDCGKKETLLATNRHFLATHECPQYSPDIQNSVIIPPVSIGQNVVLHNCVVGPNVSLGNGCVIKDARISDSLLCAGSRVTRACLHESVLGRDAELNRQAEIINISDCSIG